MSNTTAKNLLLSHPKMGLAAGNPAPILQHESFNDDSELLVEVVIPGVDPDTIDIQCENNTIFVDSEKGELVLPINSAVDISKIRADIQWGLLKIRIPHPAPPASRSIKVVNHEVAKTPAKPPAKPAGRVTKEFTDED